MFITFVEDTPASKKIAWANTGMIILNVVIALKTINRPGFMEVLVHYGFIPVRGVTLGMLTGPFVHSSWAQLLTNMAFLYMFGKGVEVHLGKKNYLIAYLVIAYASEFAHWYFHRGGVYPLVGASRIVTGLGVMYLLLYPWGKMKWIFSFFGAPILEIPSRTFWVMALWAGVQAAITFIPLLWRKALSCPLAPLFLALEDFFSRLFSALGLSLFTLVPTAGAAWDAHLGALAAGIVLHFLMPQKKGKA